MGESGVPTPCQRGGAPTLCQRGESIWQTEFGTERSPERVYEAPGRVNLIGEHIDHQGYSVLPMATEQRTTLWVAARSSRGPLLRIRNLDSSYSARDIGDMEGLCIPDGAHHWTNYIVAAYVGVAEFVWSGGEVSKVGVHDARQPLIKERMTLTPGLDILVGSNLPQGAGLSSSFALVVAATMAFLDFASVRRGGVRDVSAGADVANAGVSSAGVGPRELAEICIRAERHVGTAGGGMDHAAIILSQAGSALHISFDPLTTRRVEMPSGVVLVVANTGRAAPKATGAAKMYNKRVFELRIAAYAIMMYYRGRVPGSAESTTETPSTATETPLIATEILAPATETLTAATETLKKETERLAARDGTPTEPITGEMLLGLGIKQALAQVGLSRGALLKDLDAIFKDRYSREEIEELCPAMLREYLLEHRCGQAVWTTNDSFFLKQRVRHVLTETIRVDEFIDACQAGNSHHMGNLLSESQHSLARDYDCSCPEIDFLCDIAKSTNGCLGSRLVGAGWGGCTIHLVQKDHVKSFSQAVLHNYYHAYLNRPKDGTPNSQSNLPLLWQTPLESFNEHSETSSMLFVSTPAAAAQRFVSHSAAPCCRTSQ